MQNKQQDFSSCFMPCHVNGSRNLSLALLLAGFLMLVPDIAQAGASDPLSLTICIVINWFTGSLGRAIATLGIMVLGVGALLGKVSWGAAVTVALGVSIMFGGAQLVDQLVAGSTSVSAIGLCPVNAAGFDAGLISDVLCRLANLANAPTGRAFSTLAITFIGVACLMGKMSAGAALVTVCGIGVFHGADRIGELLVVGWGGGSAPAVGCTPTASPGALG